MSRWSADPAHDTFSAQTSGVVRGAAAGAVRAVRFDVPLAERAELPPELAERLRAEAQATGFAAGWAEGRRAAEEEARSARAAFAAESEALLAAQSDAGRQVLAAVADAVGTFERRSAPSIAGIEADLLDAAFALAQAIIGRELTTATEPGRDALTRALALAPAGRAAVVRMSPADAGTLPSTSTVGGRDVVVVADPTLARGDAVVQCDATTIDARIGAALQRAKDALAAGGAA